MVGAGVVRGLQSIGAAERPVAVIKEASSAQQRVWSATVSTLVEATEGESLSPSIIVVGEVVRLMPQVQLDNAIDENAAV